MLRPRYNHQSRKLRPRYNQQSRQLRPCYIRLSRQLRPCYNQQSRQLRRGDDLLSYVKEVTDDSDDPTDDKWRPEYVRRDWSDDSRQKIFAKKKILLATCLSCWRVVR
jgi:hypothetical protein